VDDQSGAEPREPLGVRVCRLSLDPVRGRLRHPLQVGIAIRAAMFAELILAGRVIGRAWPQPVGESDTGDKLPDAVHRAVSGRRPIGWRRWFSHVDADRRAAIDYLVAAGRWQLDGKRIVDPQAGETVLEQRELHRTMAAGELAADVPTMLTWLLVYGAGGAGRPAPRRAWRLAKAWLPTVVPGDRGDALFQSMRAALRAIRRAAMFRLFSR